MFRLVKGKTKFVHLPVTPSTVIAEGALVAWSSGKLIAATSTTPGYSIVGVLVKPIAATDADYASDRLVAVEVPVDKNAEFEFDGTSLSTSTRGTFLDLTDSVTVNGGASSKDIVLHTKYISATKGIGILNIGALSAVKA